MRFGNYEVLTRPDGKPDELGRGGFGRTYRARHVFLKTEVALKVIIDRLASDELAKKRFLKEAQETARLSHPGIGRITDFGEAEGTFFYAMELYRDGDLKEYVRRCGPLTLEETLDFVCQTAEALNHAHNRGIIHRDVKPSNLLLQQYNAAPETPGDLEDVTVAFLNPRRTKYQIKLIDFGLVKHIAKGADETTDTVSSSQFTPMFASPEQVSEGKLDGRTDIFSLGMTAWYLLHGAAPLQLANDQVVSDRVGPGSYGEQLPKSLPRAARDVIARMLEKDPARRFVDCAELLKALNPLRWIKSEDHPIGAPNAPPGESGQAGRPKPLDSRQKASVGSLDDFLAVNPVKLDQQFDLQPAGRNGAGRVFAGFDRTSRRRVRVTRVHREHEPDMLRAAAQKVGFLVHTKAPGLVPVLEMTRFSDEVAVVEADISGRAVEETLRGTGAVSLRDLAVLLWDAATGIDAVGQCGAVLGCKPEQALLTSADVDPVDWSGVRIFFAVQVFIDPADSEPSPEMTGTQDHSAMAPVKAFASLIYRGVGGRGVGSRALHSSAAYIPIPGLGAAGNRILAGALSGDAAPANCLSLLKSLLSAEAIPAESVSDRSRARHQKFIAGEIDAAPARTPAPRPGAVTAPVPPPQRTPPGDQPPPRGDVARMQEEIALLAVEARSTARKMFDIKLSPGADTDELDQLRISAQNSAASAEKAVAKAKKLAAGGDVSAARSLLAEAEASCAKVRDYEAAAKLLVTAGDPVKAPLPVHGRRSGATAPVPRPSPVPAPPPVTVFPSPNGAKIQEIQHYAELIREIAASAETLEREAAKAAEWPELGQQTGEARTLAADIVRRAWENATQLDDCAARDAATVESVALQAPAVHEDMVERLDQLREKVAELTLKAAVLSDSAKLDKLRQEESERKQREAAESKRMEAGRKARETEEAARSEAERKAREAEQSARKEEERKTRLADEAKRAQAERKKREEEEVRSREAARLAAGEAALRKAQHDGLLARADACETGRKKLTEECARLGRETPVLAARAGEAARQADHLERNIRKARASLDNGIQDQAGQALDDAEAGLILLQGHTAALRQEADHLRRAVGLSTLRDLEARASRLIEDTEATVVAAATARGRSRPAKVEQAFKEARAARRDLQSRRESLAAAPSGDGVELLRQATADEQRVWRSLHPAQEWVWSLNPKPAWRWWLSAAAMLTCAAGGFTLLPDKAAASTVTAAAVSPFPAGAARGYEEWIADCETRAKQNRDLAGQSRQLENATKEAQKWTGLSREIGSARVSLEEHTQALAKLKNVESGEDAAAARSATEEAHKMLQELAEAYDSGPPKAGAAFGERLSWWVKFQTSKEAFDAAKKAAAEARKDYETALRNAGAKEGGAR